MMWPFTQLRRRREERAIRRAFSRYVSPEVLELLEKEPGSLKSPQPEKMTIWFLLVQVRDEYPDSDAFKLGEAIDLMERYELFMTAIVCSVVLATASISAEAASPADEQKIRAAAGKLIEQLGAEIGAVFGRREGWIKNIGGSRRFDYGPIFPDFAPPSSRSPLPNTGRRGRFDGPRGLHAPPDIQEANESRKEGRY